MSGFQRFDGKIHDRAKLWAPGREDGGDVVIIAGADDADTVGLQIQTTATVLAAQLRPDEAIRLGHLLVAAGEDTKSRSRTPTDAGTDEGEVSP